MLQEPHASIAVSENSANDVAAVGASHSLVVSNGIVDPCPDFLENLLEERQMSLRGLETSNRPVFKILFLSHGTREKGLFDALGAVSALLENEDQAWCFELTFAGGVRSDFLREFNESVDQLKALGGERLTLKILDYVGGLEKREAFSHHDIFLSSSRWESFGLTTVEAMAHGMQVVAVGSDGVKGVLPAAYPYLAPPGDALAYAEMLSQCCRNLCEGEGQSLGLELRERFLQNYQLASFSENFRNALSLSCHDPLESSLSTANHAAQKEGHKVPIAVYLADQNPGHDRSFGISRMSMMVLKALVDNGGVALKTIVSKTSQRVPAKVAEPIVLPWGTRRKGARFLTDHLHPVLRLGSKSGVVNYFPKGYLPFLSLFSCPSVVTIHDTIIQYDEDHYPEWRSKLEYRYWAKVLKHTLQHADRILTVSKSSKQQILHFMKRHQIPEKEVTVTYEPCAYHDVPQPVDPPKKNHVVHLASVEPHKGTARLVRWWNEAGSKSEDLPSLHLIGSVPDEVKELIESTKTIEKRPFLSDEELKEVYRGAKALILPSEIEGFGLPALEAYYLGTPVCFVRGTSVEEVLSVATAKGGMSLDKPDSLFTALREVLAMDAAEVHESGIKLREFYAPEKVAKRMVRVFREVSKEYS